MYKTIPPIQESAEELRCLYKQEPHRLKRPRLHALYLLASGQVQQRQEVARLLGVSRNSVAHWLNLYAAEGLNALLQVQPLPGRAPALTPAQLEQVRSALARPEGFGSYGEVQRWIREALGVEMKYHAVYRLVHDKLGARLKVPRPTHPKKTRRR